MNNRPLDRGIGRATLQFRDRSGVWRTIGETDADPQQIIRQLRGLASRYSDGVRAVDGSGRLLDLLF